MKLVGYIRVSTVGQATEGSASRTRNAPSAPGPGRWADLAGVPVGGDASQQLAGHAGQPGHAGPVADLEEAFQLSRAAVQPVECPHDHRVDHAGLDAGEELPVGRALTGWARSGGRAEAGPGGGGEQFHVGVRQHPVIAEGAAE